jgi:hypothetical protein
MTLVTWQVPDKIQEHTYHSRAPKLTLFFFVFCVDLWFFFLRPVPVSLDCPFSIAPLVFSNVYFLLEVLLRLLRFALRVLRSSVRFAWFCLINCLHWQNIVDHKYQILHANVLYCCNCWYNYECIFVIAPWGTLIGIKYWYWYWYWGYDNLLILKGSWQNVLLNCKACIYCGKSFPQSAIDA